MKIALVGRKGGISKSTLTAAIAWELHARGCRVLVVDSDNQGTLRTAAEVAAEAGLPSPSLVVMGRDMAAPGQLPRVAETFEHVLIDTPGRQGDVVRAALMVADLALVPVGQSAADVWGISDTLELIREAQTVRPELRAAAVLARVQPRTTLGRQAAGVLEGTDLPLLQARTTFRVAWQESLAAGQGVAQYAPADTAAEEARALVDELLGMFAGKGRTRRKSTSKKGRKHHGP